MLYSEYKRLAVTVSDNGVVEITINRPEILNAADFRMHWEMAEIWKTFDRDSGSKVAIITGAGKAFSAGAEISVVEATATDPAENRRQLRHARAIVENILATPKPIISAINGVAVGAGLAVALTADVSFIAESARLTDGHARLGIAAGDHAAMIWPLCIGMARAKYYLLTADFISGPEAERMGLVTRCVPDAELLPTARALAERFASASQIALHSTKQSLNQWYRLATPVLEASLAHEFMNLFHEDALEGVAAFRDKRAPDFPSARSAFKADIPD